MKKQSKSFKKFLPPIFVLRNYFKNSLKKAINQSLPKELESKILIDLTPSNIHGDFTFSTFEIARFLKMDFNQLACAIAKNLETHKKYVNKVNIVNGFINVTIKPDIFYADSLKYILAQDLLNQESNYKNKRVLLVSDQPNSNNGLVSKFIKHLYTRHLYDVETASIDKTISDQETRSFINRLANKGTVLDLGHDVRAIHLYKDKYALLQKQNKALTPLSFQLALLNSYNKEYHPLLVIFSLDLPPQAIEEFLNIVTTLQIFKAEVRLVTLPDADIDNIVNSYLIKRVTNICAKINKSFTPKLEVNLTTSIKFDKTELAILKVLSYAPEVFRKATWQASPKAIINYIEYCQNYKSQIYQYIKNTPTDKNISHRLLLHGVYKVLSDYLALFKK